jgi:hypothetical protein
VLAMCVKGEEPFFGAPAASRVFWASRWTMLRKVLEDVALCSVLAWLLSILMCGLM